jgi:glycogen debranching enzyme
MPERGCHALALDGDKRRVDSLTSNIGHLLWSGLLDQDQADATAARLMGDELYSGWGALLLLLTTLLDLRPGLADVPVSAAL